MIVVNYREQLRAAYEAGAWAAFAFQNKLGPKPDYEAWLKTREHPPVVRGG